MAYTVTFFDIRGRAECIRLILTAAGQTYTDNRISLVDDWPKLKPTTPWGQVPLLDIGDQRLGQSLTICRYLGRKHNLCGTDEWEAAKCDEYADACNDFFTEWALYMFEKDPERKKALYEKFMGNTLPFYLSKFNSIAEKSGTPFLIGKEMTWGDIFIAEKMDRLQQSGGAEILDAYPHLKQFKENVYATPNIKAYVEKRPHSDY